MDGRTWLHEGQTGSLYLNCMFDVITGSYEGKKFWSLIGLHSPKGPEWAAMGRATIKGILSSAQGIGFDDDSEEAQRARIIEGFHQLDLIEFLARITIERGHDAYSDKNKLDGPMTPDDPVWHEYMETGLWKPQGVKTEIEPYSIYGKDDGSEIPF